MRSTNNPRADDFSWDGSHKNHRPGRALRVAPDSRTRLLRAAQTDRCATCGNLVEWYPRPGGRTIPLHPRELPAADIPPREGWNITAGLAHPGHDGSPWCRVRHHALCPATPASNRSALLDGMRRDLALNTRRLKDTGAFTPRRDLPLPGPDPAPAAPARPVVHLLYLRYLAPGPLDTIRCVAQTRTRHRCTHPVLDPDALPGTWTLIPVDPRPPGRHQLPLADTLMTVYDLTALPYADQLRWRAQRCPTHAATPGAADTARTDWEPFNPRTHHQHIQHQLPDALPARRERP
jgi:hypothetical protein